MDINLTRPLNDSDWKNPCDGYFGKDHYKIAVCVINAILTLTALFGNGLILITIWKTPSLHSVTSILLSSLAASDLAVGLISHPFLIAASFCRIAIVDLLGAMLGHILSIASFYTVTAIAVDRFLALHLHLRYEAVVTQFRVKFLVIFIWIFSGIVGSTQMWSSKIFYATTSPVTISFLVVNFLVYLRIYFIVRRHQSQIQQQQQRPQANNENILIVTRLKKSALNTFLVYVVLLCCYLPYSVYMALGGVFNSSSISITTATLVFLNSSLNPLLYCWRDPQIRTAVKQLVYG